MMSVLSRNMHSSTQLKAIGKTFKRTKMKKKSAEKALNGAELFLNLRLRVDPNFRPP